MLPIRHRLPVLLKMLADMVASFLPTIAEVNAESAAPASPCYTLLPCHLYMPLGHAYLASVTPLMMVNEVFFEKVYVQAQLACKHLRALLIGFLMSLPVILLLEAFAARSALVFGLLGRTSRSFIS